MLSFLKQISIKRLSSKYQKLMKEARDIQRSGDLKLYARKISAAEAVAQEIELLKNS